MQNKITIAPHAIASMSYFLNTILDHEHALYKKIRSFHNNMGRPGIQGGNGYIERQHILVEGMIYEIEEQIFHLGYYPEISLKGFLVLNLSQDLRKKESVQDCSIKCLLEDIGSIIVSLKENVEMFPCSWYGIDSNFLTTLIKTHRKIARMLTTQLWRSGEFFSIKNNKEMNIIPQFDLVN